ncbi:DUF1631 domain-containing protein [Dyella nitratireducens]|uniref:Thymidine phosphorylase n=1 Tax=Dyella nitratireducens TaxID=1849580 RepID=A0ABQ1GW75_9GAMM|nr:DUF1631 domain-containing protein [Dyella nitratireducens]GGA51133.1 hypothetical protein GCM10010981_45730 [Dyella nitratireducens]GLQ42687.1 hypothetical protein GCM10007902_25370 [Dyella nitratireducens]
MKEANDSSNVVNLGQRLDPSSGRGGDLLNAVRNISSRRLQQYIGNMFEHVDDALFDLAEKAENNAAQMHYFDGMREVRKRRPIVERAFLALVSRELNDFASGNHSPVASPTTNSVPTPAPGSVELSLVADNELEESLAITSMIGKNESRLSRDLFAVNQRLSVICGGTRIEDATNPIGPALLAQAFRQAMRELNADMRVKLIIYKLFDRYVMSALEELYQEVNAELMRAGVLPQLRHEVVRSGGAGAGAAAGGTAAASGEIPQPLPADDSEASAELLQTLRTLFSARRAHPNVPLSAMTAGPLPTANELIGALSVLQSQAAMLPMPQPAAPHVSSVDIAEQVLHLKEQLMSQLGSLRGQRPGQIATIDEDTIDLVGMLFEFILEDRNLPPQMQVLLARLQIPYLKAAILDRKLFAHRQHPARRLLDGLADAAKSWSEESDRDGRLHDTIKAIVERLLQEFDDDMTIFDRLSAELQQFQESNRRRAELAEQRVAESTRGREKLEQARRRAAREILNRIGDHVLPPLIHGVLSRAWANYLVLTILRKGEDSNDFREALRFVDAFIASTKPTRTPEAKRDLRQLLPGIERALRKGLANVAFQDADIERLLAQLHAYYRHQLGEAPSTPAQPQTAEAAPAPLPIPESIQPIAESVDDLDDVATEPAEDAIAPDVREQLEQVKVLKPGIWLEFIGQDDHFERAKLSWISPMSGRYLFVNRRGLKVGDYSPYELAMVMAEGRARILASNALFDRAMDAIVDRLSHEEVRPGESP